MKPLEISLKGKIAIITGASRGIGQAIALRYASLGAKIALVYRSSKEEAENTIKKIKEMGSDGIAIQCDASDTAASNEAVARTIKHFGDLHILVNNVAISHNIPFLALEEEMWKDTVSVNINSMYNFSRASLLHMRGNRYGRVLNIGSVCGVRPIAAVPVHYATTKGAMNAFTYSLAKEMARYNILVNSIAPGLVETDLATGLPDNRIKDFEKFCPLGRIGTTAEIADFTAFLVSDINSYMTGETVIVSGGL